MNTLLAMIAVHAVLLLTFVLAATMATRDVGTSLWSVSVGLGISQTVLIGTFGSLAYAAFVYRIRWSYRLLVLQWLCFSVPLLAVVKQRPMPWSLLITELTLFLGAFLVGWIVRLVARKGLTFKSKDSEKPRNVIGLMDIFILLTIIAVFLAVTFRYNENLPGGMFSGLGYILMIVGSVLYGMPFSAILAVVAIGYGVQNSTFAWYWGRTWLASVTVIFIVFKVIISQSNDQESTQLDLPVSIIFVSAFVSTVVSAMYLRYNGVMLRRLKDMRMPIGPLQEVANP
jgi:hypothetical protein